MFCGVLFFSRVSVFFSLSGTISGQGEGEGKCLRGDREIRLFIPDGFRHDGQMSEWESAEKRREGGREGKEEFWIGPLGVLGEEMVWKMVGSLAPVAGGAWRDATAVEDRRVPTTPACPF